MALKCYIISSLPNVNLKLIQHYVIVLKVTQKCIVNVKQKLGYPCGL